jgi:hypothetical protein
MQAVLHTLAALAVSASVAGSASAQPTIPPPGQPSRKGTIGSFEIIGNSLVSAQQVRFPLDNSNVPYANSSS